DDTVIHYQKYVYLMMNKPPGYISSTWDKHDQTVIDLLKPRYKHFKPFPVGRLDKDMEGLFILTNNGKIAHELLSLKKGLLKRYSKNLLCKNKRNSNGERYPSFQEWCSFG